MITFKVIRVKRNGKFSLIHSREYIDAIMKAQNMLVDALEVAYNEINRLSKEIERGNYQYLLAVRNDDWCKWWEIKGDISER